MPHQMLFRSQRAETKSALIVCMRFSASSKTLEYFDSKTSSVTSKAPQSFVTSVLLSWKAGIGHDFRHYKGKMYRLLGLAPHSETLEPMAVYQLLYGDFGLWVRPAKMFFEEIEVDGRRMRRFERV